jgi:hypothetical protein
MNREPEEVRVADDAAEKHVADDIERSIGRATSIEEEALLNAAELEEIEYRERS